jgi:hypothetical protein
MLAVAKPVGQRKSLCNDPPESHTCMSSRPRLPWV